MSPIIDRRGRSLVPSASRTPPESNASGTHDSQKHYANDAALMTKSKKLTRRTIDEIKETFGSFEMKINETRKRYRFVRESREIQWLTVIITCLMESKNSRT